MSPAETNQYDMIDQFESLDEMRSTAEAPKGKKILIREEELQDLEYVDISGSPYRGVKRVLDVILSVFILILLLIPFLLIALVIYLDDPGTIVFSQYRVGRGGKRFKIYKLRTMRMDAPRYISTSELEDPDKWITRFGRILRKSSLDEIPQLVNVIKGDMSLVGPRPLIQDEEEIHRMRMRFGAYQTRPGITGLAQIKGRDIVSAAEKVRWDVVYVQRFSFRQDVSILLTTFLKVLKRENIVEGSQASKENTL